jgi:anti-sigma factor RsiW
MISPHIPFNRLADLVEGRLTPDERTQLEEHITTCRRCSGDVAQLERLIDRMRTDTNEDAPARVIARAVGLFHSRTEPLSASSRDTRYVLAVLRFDSVGLAPAFGVRSGEPGARQLLYSTETHDIDLRIESTDPTWILSGQVLGEFTAGGIVDLKGETISRQTLLNEQCEFILPAVPAGHYLLNLHLPNVDIEVGELKIGT